MSSEARGRRRRRRPTIADVAARAGVSKTTVSFVMNDRPNTGLHPQTRERVLAAVRDLGYVPNRQARNLGRQRTGVLGYHVLSEELDETQLFSLSLFAPLLRAADRRDHQVVAFTAGPGEDVVDSMRRIVAAHAVDGFVLHDVQESDPRVRYLVDIGFPFVVWGVTEPDQPQCWVELDQRQGFHDVVDHLVARGHRRVGLVGSTRPGHWWQVREDAFRERMAHHGLAVAPEDVVHGASEAVEPLLRDILRRADRPTALVTVGDLLAARVYRAASAVGLRIGTAVGTELAVTGFDPLLWMLDPPLTTLSISFAELAELLVDRCLREIEGPTGEPGHLLATQLLVRDSG